MAASQALFIPGPLPGLNEIIEAKRTRYGAKADAYSALKAKWTAVVAMAARPARLQPVGVVRLQYHVREPNRRRDPGNFEAGAKKLIEDGLVKAGILQGDGWRHIQSYGPTTWSLSKRPGVLVTIEEVTGV